MGQNNWTVPTRLGLLLFLSLCYGGAESNDVYVASGCHDGFSRLELNCVLTGDPGFISLQWDATIFGRSNCSNLNCCPDDNDCTTPVKPHEQFESDHIKELTACNGQSYCSVQVLHSASCHPGTNYETVTYQCITPVTTDRSTSDLPADVWTAGDLEDSSTSTVSSRDTSHSKPPSYTHTQSTTQSPGASLTKSTVTNPTTGGDDGSSMNDDGGSDNVGVIVGVIIAVLLLVIILAVILFIWYRRRKQGAKDTDVEDSNNIKRAPGQDKIDRTYSHLSNRSNSSYNGYDSSSTNYDVGKKLPPPPPRTVDGNGHIPALGLALDPNGKPLRANPSPRQQEDQEDSSCAAHPEETDYSYTYSHVREQNNAAVRDENPGSKDGGLIYADIQHKQNEEYIDNDSDDEMVLTDNDLYHVTGEGGDGGGDTSGPQSAEHQTEDGDDDADDDMVLTDNDLYNTTTEHDDIDDSSAEKTAEHQAEDDSDDDMVLTDNDLYNTTTPNDGMEDSSVEKTAEHQAEDDSDDDMVLTDNDLYHASI